MYVIEVIPLKRGVHVESLSYFSSIEYTPGTILTIPVRSQAIQGVVTEVKPVSGAKAALRAATFSLRRLPSQKESRALSPAFVETAKELAEYYACQPGAVLYGLLSPGIRDGKIPLPHTHHTEPHKASLPEILQGKTEERFLAYRALVRETFAHAGSLLFVVPTSIEAAEAKRRLAAGIEERTVLITSIMTLRAQKETYQALEDFSKTKLIITTPSYALLERHDITTVIVESERSQHYRARTRPYIDYRHALRVHSRHGGRRMILGDLVIRTEEEVKRRDEVYETLGETPKRISLPGKTSVVKLKHSSDSERPFVLFSPKIIAAIKETRTKKGRSFLLAARRGLAPVVACVDCGHVFRSPESGAPYSLVRITKDGEEKRFFVCSASGERRRAADVCTECGSWRLRERGIGIQHVYDELTKECPDIPIILFDHTTAQTYKKASFLSKKFYETKGAVMLGTQMALPYLTEQIETSIVVSMDALRAVPSWRGQEETLGTLLRLREYTSGTLHLQMRTELDELTLHAKNGSIKKFYDEEIALRKEWKYPPFSALIHLTWQGSPEAVQKIESDVTNLLSDYSPLLYSAPPSQKKTIIRYGLIRVPGATWPAEELVAALRKLPPSVRVVVNPDRII